MAVESYLSPGLRTRGSLDPSMLVRLGAATAALVRVVRSPRAPRALPGPRSAGAPAMPEAVYTCEEPSTRFDRQRAEQVCAAYRAADLVQPRPGLFLHVQA